MKIKNKPKKSRKKYYSSLSLPHEMFWFVLDDLSIYVEGDQTGIVEGNIYTAKISLKCSDGTVTLESKTTSLHETNVCNKHLTLPLEFVEKFMVEYQKFRTKLAEYEVEGGKETQKSN